MATETITLAQALKQRKRLAQRIGQIDQRIGKNNSVPQGNVMTLRFMRLRFKRQVSSLISK